MAARGELVCGIPGVGKDWWIDNNMSELVKVNTNRLLSEVVHEDNVHLGEVIGDPDKLAYYKHRVGMRAVDLATKQNIVIDTHLIHANGDELKEDSSIFEYIRSDTMNIIMAKPSTILERRIGDIAVRNRQIPSLNGIAEMQDREWTAALEICDAYDMRLREVNND